MDGRQSQSQQLERERAVYSYLEALESGDIDGIITALEQAIYDAPLDEMIIEAHQSYFQDEPVQPRELSDVDTYTDLVALTPLRVRNQQRARRRLPWWARTLAALLIVGVLVGSFMALLALSHAGTNTAATTKARTPVCKPSVWQQSDSSISGSLSSVIALSPMDAWAVGSQISRNENMPLLEHWDGLKWNTVPGPHLSGAGSLQAIAALAPNNVWAVGAQYNLGSNPKTKHGSPLIEHWDGQQWSLVASPAARQGESITNELSAITAISENDIWTTGVWRDANGHTQGTLVEHWNGQNWRIVPDQGSQSRSSVLGSIIALSGGQLMAGGAQIGASDQVYHALLERWDGSHWEQVDTTSLGQDASAILGLSAASANDIWAVVQESIPVSGQQVSTSEYIAHWNGQTWSRVSIPGWAENGEHSVTRIFALNSKSVWIVDHYNVLGVYQPVLTHWDGKTWSEFEDFPADARATDLAVSGETIWLVGSVDDMESSSITHPLLAQQTSCA